MTRVHRSHCTCFGARRPGAQLLPFVVVCALALSGCSDESGGALDKPGGSVPGGSMALGGNGNQPGQGGSSSLASGGSAAQQALPIVCGSVENAFGGSAALVPGTLQAEDFDAEGYSDATPGNEGAAYRSDVDVDIKAIDAGYALGWMTSGEWVQYTVEVQTAGTYALTLSAGSAEAGRSVSVSSCETAIAQDVAIPQVAAWGQFEDVTVSVQLSAGLQVLRVTVGDADYLDLDKLTLELLQAGGSGGSSGGSGSGGSGTTETCPLPSQFSWTSSGPLAEPKNTDGASLKDFSVTKYNGKYLVYATTYAGGYKGFTSTFSDFSQWSNAAQPLLASGGVAPTLFYMEPKNTWVLVDQWGACPFLYRTSQTPDDPTSWSARTCMMDGASHPGSGGTGPIDQSVICDDSDCYLFYADDNGGIYRGSMPIANFPGKFGTITQIMQEPTSLVFEGVQVYAVKGSSKYLMIIENDSTRAFRAWTADSLSGSWTAMPTASSTATPFAGENNVTWPGGKWTRDISHGDLVREDPSQKMLIDPCNLQMLYQGRDPAVDASYDTLPYRPGLLTLVK